MPVLYKDHMIKPAVYDRAKGVPFIPRVTLTRDVGSSTLDKTLDWPDRACATREEAEQLGVQLARAAIDEGAGID